jgi:hypothetical protein
MASVRTVECTDLDAIEHLMEGRLAGSGTAWRQRLAWQYDANPWKDSAPCGVVLVHDGRIVGYHFGMTQPIWLGDAATVATFGLDLYIDESFRGGLDSIGLIRAIVPPGPDVLVATSSANDASMEIWLRLRAAASCHGDVALIKPVRRARLALAVAERALRGSPPAVVPRPWRPRALPVAPMEPRAGWRSEALEAPFDEAAGLWCDVRRHFELSTDRDQPYLQWRYGEQSQGGTLIGLYDAAGALRAWYAFRLSDRGAMVSVRVLKLLDMVAAPDDAQAIAACVTDLTVRAGHLAHVVEARGMRAEFRAGLRAGGFRVRRLPSNPFLIWARPRRLQALPPPAAWHLVAADGDAGFA